MRSSILTVGTILAAVIWLSAWQRQPVRTHGQAREYCLVGGWTFWESIKPEAENGQRRYQMKETAQICYEHDGGCNKEEVSASVSFLGPGNPYMEPHLQELRQKMLMRVLAKLGEGGWRLAFVGADPTLHTDFVQTMMHDSTSILIFERPKP